VRFLSLMPVPKITGINLAAVRGALGRRCRDENRPNESGTGTQRVRAAAGRVVCARPTTSIGSETSRMIPCSAEGEANKATAARMKIIPVPLTNGTANL